MTERKQVQLLLLKIKPMNKHSLKVVLKISKDPVPVKINKSRLIVDTMALNAPLFPNPVPSPAAVTAATNALENAWNDAADGGKTKIAMMHAKEDDLMKLLNDLAHYVERVANGDMEIVIAAGMAVKQPSHPSRRPAFEVIQAEDRGAVILRTRPRPKTVYKWEFCIDPITNNVWTLAKMTDVTTTNFGDLEVGTKYWFRVVYINKNGETPGDPEFLVVN